MTMTNLSGIRPGDLWSLDGTTYNVRMVERIGAEVVLTCRRVGASEQELTIFTISHADVSLVRQA